MDSKLRFTLDPSPKKYVCPSCNKKRFVRYIDITTGEYHPDIIYGRCDRASECGYQRIPSLGTPAFRVEFLLCQTISDKAYKLTEKNYRVHIVPKSVVKEKESGAVWIAEWFLDGSTLPKIGQKKYYDGENTMVADVMPKEVKLPTYHDPELLQQSTPDNLTKWLLTKFSPKEVEEALVKYKVTGLNNPWEASTVFWQIDMENQVRGGKIIDYSPKTGKRVKYVVSHLSWIHAVLKLTDFNLVQCLYGLHLVNEYPKDEVAIVESEKTAIYMSIKDPGKVWLSCGSLSGLKPALLEPIINRKITAYPDTGKACLDWKLKSEKLRNDRYDITVNEALEAENLPDGSDLIDYYEQLKIKK